MNKVTVSAPGKLMLFGEQAVVWGRPCLVTAIDRRIVVEIEKTKEKEKETCSLFVDSAVKNFYQRFKPEHEVGIKITKAFSSQYGLGSSSAVTVAVIYGLAVLFDKKLAKKEIFDLSFKSVLDVQKIGSGFDVACAIWGGVICFQDKAKLIIPLKCPTIPIMIVYTGFKANTTKMIRQVESLRKKNFKPVENIFAKIENLVNQAKIDLEGANWPALGKLMNQNQALLEKLGLGTKKIDRLVLAARQAGAWGAKLSGAGGGDCIIILVDSEIRKKAESALVRAGGKILPLLTETEGVRIEK